LPFSICHLSIRLLALDIDGTLLDSQGRLPDENRRAIADAQAAGVEIVLATGRRYDFARAIFEQLPPPLTLILSNGAIVKTDAGRTLMRQLLPQATARQVLAWTPHHRDTAAVVFDRPRERQVVFETIDWEHPRHRRYFEANRPFIGQHQPLEDALTEDPVQVMFTGGCVEMRTLFELLRAGNQAGSSSLDGNGTARFSVALTEYLSRDFSLVDVVGPGCSKGSALEQWAATRGLTRAEVMAVGDNLNDLEMLEYAGRPVVMGNGLAELRSGRGWAVTASNDEAGVARAIDTYVLGRASNE